jgi:hypothetical protein
MKKERALCKCGKSVLARGMCKKCYGNAYRMGTFSDGNPYKKGTSRNPNASWTQRMEHASEIMFIKNYFTHNDYVYQPAMFHLGKAGRYTPDFYDPQSGTFIEVVGTRQAYHVNKHKYAAFKARFPTICLEILNVNGEFCNGKNLPETT